MDQVIQNDLQCSACAGQCAYSPADRALKCRSCGSTHEIAVDPDADPSREFHYHPDLPHTEQTVVTGDRTHQCETCGGEVVFTGAALTERCAYCDGPLVLAGDDQSYAALGLIPLSLTAEEAAERTTAWIAKRWAAPNDLGAHIAEGRITGIYVPFWTFDSKEAVDYMVQYRVKRGDNWVTKTFSSSMKVQFDDLLVPASPHVTPLIRDGILHEFDPGRLVPYTPGFLAGFAADRHHQTVKEGLRANAADKDLLLRNRIKRHSGKSKITNISYKTDTTGIHYRRILLPVWILHYRYGGKPMKVVVCGLHGRTFGERPFSHVKLLAYSALLSAGAIALGWLWGAAGIL